MIDYKKIQEVTGKIHCITHDLVSLLWSKPANSSSFIVLSVKSLLLQLRALEVILEEIINEEEEV